MTRTFATLAATLALVAGCSTDADVASDNVSKSADSFQVYRRIVFYNGITGDYIVSIEGLCSKGNSDTDRKVSFTCKVGPNEFKKHYLGVSDNVTWFMEQLEPATVGTYRYVVIFKPTAILPDIKKS